MTDSEWPQRDPITGRMICRMCWYGIHYARDIHGHLISACDDMACDCVHSSDDQARYEERVRQRKARGFRRQLERMALEAPDNPLRAENPDYKPKLRGRPPA